MDGQGSEVLTSQGRKVSLSCAWGFLVPDENARLTLQCTEPFPPFPLRVSDNATQQYKDWNKNTFRPPRMEWLMDVHPKSSDIFCPLCPKLESPKPSPPSLPRLLASSSMDRKMSNDALAEKGSDFFRAGKCVAQWRQAKRMRGRRTIHRTTASFRGSAACARIPAPGSGGRRWTAGPVASSQAGISSTWSLGGDDVDDDDVGMLAGTSASACSDDEPKRTENMEKKDQSAAHWISQ